MPNACAVCYVKQFNEMNFLLLPANTLPANLSFMTSHYERNFSN